MMQAEFRREQDRSYLILKAEDKEDYQIRMIEENAVQGLLPFTIRSFNGTCSYYYDITSRQTYMNLYSNRDLQWQDLRNFFTSLEEVWEECDRYLLDRMGICFRPEYCFKKAGEGRTEWIFAREDKEDMLAMAEFIMEHVNHKDTASMELSYRFYSEVKDGTFCLSEFMNVFAEPKTEKDDRIFLAPKYEMDREGMEIREEDKDREKFKSQGKGQEGDREKARGQLKNREREKIRDDLDYMTGVLAEKQGGIWEKFKGMFFSKREGKNSGDIITKTDGNHWEDNDRDCLEYDDSMPQETTIINRDGQIKGYLRPMTAKLRGRDILLEKYPCVIGKLPEFADVVLNFNSISRMHARISREGEAYYIEDLNSRNGTRLNGFPLEQSEKVLLRPGDEVAFADLIYVFE